MKIINIHEAKPHWSAVLAEVERDQVSYLICRNGKPIADLVPHRTRDRLTPHAVMREVKIAYNPTEPLTDDEWPEK